MLRTGVRCPADSLLAEDVENEVLYDLLQALSHATNFKAALESNITDLQGRVADLERDLAPVQRELDQVEGELRRMGVDRVRGVVTEADIDQLRRSALERKEHLEARLEVLGPGRLEELERTRAILAAVTDELNSADSAPEWWLEYQVYTRILPPELVDEYDGEAGPWNDPEEVLRQIESGGEVPESINKSPQMMVLAPGAVLRDLLARLQAEVWVSSEGMTVKGLIEAPVGDAQPFGSAGQGNGADYLQRRRTLRGRFHHRRSSLQRQHPARFYTPGEHATEFEEMAGFGLDVRNIGPNIGQASGIKMCYAAMTKGTAALHTELLMAAQLMGLFQPLQKEFQSGQGAVYQRMERGIPGMPARSRRWVSEMEEIEATFLQLGMTPHILEGWRTCTAWWETLRWGRRNLSPGIGRGR